MAYSKRSHQCWRCPMDGRNDKSDGCPKWISESAGIVAISPIDREERPVVGCLDAKLPDILRSLTRNVQGHAAAAESGRNETVLALGRIEGSIPSTVRAIMPAAIADGLRSMIEDRTEQAALAASSKE